MMRFDDFLTSGRTARTVLKGMQEMIKWVEVADPGILKDADTPEDLMK